MTVPSIVSIARKASKSESRVTVCVLVKDNIFFLEELFKHYRNLGVGSFFILDDGSTDGSKEFILDQSDCSVFKSDYRYGQIVDGVRTDVIWKQNLVEHSPKDHWAISVDADEFLAIEDATRLDALLDRLEAQGARSALAAMIDLYPSDVAQIRDPSIRKLDPDGEWYFDAGPYVAHGSAGQEPTVLGGGVKERLREKFGLKDGPEPARARSLVDRLLGRRPRQRAGFNFKVFKTPLLRNGDGLRFHNSHWVTPGPSTPDILPLAHYKFVANLQTQIDSAIKTKAYPMGSKAYAVYDRILQRMEAEAPSFLFEGSRRYRTPEDFYAAGSAFRPEETIG